MTELKSCRNGMIGVLLEVQRPFHGLLIRLLEIERSLDIFLKCLTCFGSLSHFESLTPTPCTLGFRTRFHFTNFLSAHDRILINIVYIFSTFFKSAILLLFSCSHIDFSAQTKTQSKANRDASAEGSNDRSRQISCLEKDAP